MINNLNLVRLTGKTSKQNKTIEIKWTKPNLNMDLIPANKALSKGPRGNCNVIETLNGLNSFLL